MTFVCKEHGLKYPPNEASEKNEKSYLKRWGPLARSGKCCKEKGEPQKAGGCQDNYDSVQTQETNIHHLHYGLSFFERTKITDNIDVN